METINDTLDDAVDLDECLEIAVGLARDAGRMARAAFTGGMQKSWKDDNSPVTETDTAINDLVIETLSARFPDHGIVGEESSRLKDDAIWNWVCDPIDGTIPFAHAYPTFAFALALCKNGAVQIAVAYDPFLDRMLTAKIGGGTHLNGVPVRVHERDGFVGTVTDLEALWMLGLSTDMDLIRLPGLIEREGGKLCKICSTVYAGMLVAMGELAAVITKGDKPWDVAVLKLLVDEAGGRVTDLYGDEQRYDRLVNGCVVSNANLHEKYLALIREAASGR